MKKLRAAAVVVAFFLAACTSDDQGGGGGGLLDPRGGGSVDDATLVILGPGGEVSGELELEAGSRTEDFTATLLDGSGDPLEDVNISFTPAEVVKGATSSASLSSAPTDEDGVVTFAVETPDEVVEAETLTIHAQVRVSGELVEADYEIVVVPQPPPVLTLTGPDEVAPGVATAGYTARLTTGSGDAIPETFVTLTPNAGVINAPPDRPSSGGAETDSFGRVRFSFTPENSIVRDTTVTITGTTNVNGLEIEERLPVIVRSDIFAFTQPEAGTPLFVGSANCEPLGFRWTHASAAGGQGVTGTVRLSVNNSARLVLNDDILNANQSVVIGTDEFSQGEFTEPVCVFNNVSGFSTVTARDAESSSRIATLNLQFVDTPGAINLVAAPLCVTTSPSARRFSNLTVTVLNEANEPITGVDVEFMLTQGASSSVNERVFPPGATTDAQGQATSQYEAGPAIGTAVIRVRVSDGSLSNPREITINDPATLCPS